MITITDISKTIHQRLHNKKNFEKVTRKDIERIIRYYCLVITMIMADGGFLTLPVYRNHMKERSIHLFPIMRRVIIKTNKRFIYIQKYIRSKTPQS